MLQKEYLAGIILGDGSIIKVSIDGISCSHNGFKKLCVSCAQHWTKDAKFREAFYETNKKYLERKWQ
jgi:hypothetical protein